MLKTTNAKKKKSEKQKRNKEQGQWIEIKHKHGMY